MKEYMTALHSMEEFKEAAAKEGVHILRFLPTGARTAALLSRLCRSW